MNTINPQAKGQRKALKTIGGIFLIAGLLLSGFGVIDFFQSMNSMEQPKYFWCLFVGLPMFVIGIAALAFAYMGKTSRYVAGETVPVAADSLNYLGKNTKEGVENFSEAISSGIHKSKNNITIEEKLKTLDTLFENKHINEQEYKKQKERILNSI